MITYPGWSCLFSERQTDFLVLYSSTSNSSFPHGFTNGKGQKQVLNPKMLQQGQGWAVTGHHHLLLQWDLTSKWRKRGFLVVCRAAKGGERDHCWPMQKIKVFTQDGCRGLIAQRYQMSISQDVQHFTPQGTHNSPWNYIGLHLYLHIAPVHLERAVEENWLRNKDSLQKLQ